MVSDEVISAVQEMLSAIPGGYSWLLPVTDDEGRVVDFRIAAASESGRDIYGRGAARVDARLRELYPSIVDGPLWRLYQEVQATGVPGSLADFRYSERQAGVVAESQFDITVRPALGGLLVWWRRLDEDRLRLERTELLGRLGWAEYDLATGVSDWSPGAYRVFERDPALGPMSRAEQGAAVLPEDRGLAEAAWQTLDTGLVSDVTVRFRLGGGGGGGGEEIKYIRVLSDVARDSDENPLKIYAVVQDVTAREDERTEIERLTEALRTREITALAEHRLAAQLQNMIQPVPREPFGLHGLEAMVGYLPAERAAQVGGDWYHAQDLADGTVVLTIGDVAGHGLDAASGMAHLRYALMAWLSIGIRDPGTLLGHLNRLSADLRITGTAVVAFYDPATRELQWARAGHPPPIVARAGAAQPLERAAGMLLGADPGAQYPVVVHRLVPDDLVLLFTDGLVERRTTMLLDTVIETMADLSATVDAQSLGRLRGILDDPSPDDDTCTLALRVLG
jgi:PAS domain-containing protein